MRVLKDALNGVKGFVFPNQCIGCGQRLFQYEKNLCRLCWAYLPLIDNQSGGADLLLDRLGGRVDLFQGYAFMKFYKGSLSQKILYKIKYNRGQALAREMGEKFGEHLQRYFKITDNMILAPVPLHPMKRQMRGFNQSEEIAIGISKSLNIPIDNQVLERVQFHISQTQKRKDARWDEIKNDFSSNFEKVQDRDIILVDDVCTSGATIEACANSLKMNQVKSISLLTLAIAGEKYQ
ncbi:MAG: hypothetical protein LC105_03550 [Chitinophagales bacterium]|nr:hypothetical protein [Chitinophagales bacterium]MCZ2392917.1 hypothetical protein [Chitinophagales bacterium]